MSRANGGGLLYRSDEDRRRFLGLVAELPERMGTEVHAFVLLEAGRGGPAGAGSELCGGSARDPAVLEAGGATRRDVGLHPSPATDMSIIHV